MKLRPLHPKLSLNTLYLKLDLTPPSHLVSGTFVFRNLSRRCLSLSKVYKRKKTLQIIQPSTFFINVSALWLCEI